MVKIVFIGGFICLFFGIILISNRQEQPKDSLVQNTQDSQAATSKPVKAVSKKAYFAIYTNDTFRIFTDSKYHNLSEDVFIQAENPNSVHVINSGVTWNYFFKTLPIFLTKECLTTGTKQTFCTKNDFAMKFYLNGIRDDELLTKEIHENDLVLISYGRENEKQIQKQLETLSMLATQ